MYASSCKSLLLINIPLLSCVCWLSGDSALGFVHLPVNVRLLPVVHQAKRLVIPEGVSPPTLLNRHPPLLRCWILFSRIYKELCVCVCARASVFFTLSKWLKLIIQWLGLCGVMGRSQEPRRESPRLQCLGCTRGNVFALNSLLFISALCRLPEGLHADIYKLTCISGYPV